MSYKSDVITVTSTQHEQPFTEESLGFVPGSLYLSVEDQNIRFWYGGRVPTATEGHPVFANGGAVFNASGEITELRIIAMAGTAKVNYTVKGR